MAELFPAQLFSSAEPIFPNEAYGAPRCDILPVAADTIGAQFRAGKCILKRGDPFFFRSIAYCVCSRRM